MRVTMKYSSFNKRRYGNPWIARVKKWEIAKNPEIEFGRYLGDDGGGELEIEAEKGDILRFGQKDHRGNNTENSWGVVNESGSVEVIDQPYARELFMKKNSPLPDNKLTQKYTTEDKNFLEYVLNIDANELLDIILKRFISEKLSTEEQVSKAKQILKGE